MVVAMFVIIMDILKYCFGIDPVHEEREKIRRDKRRKRPVIQRFTYVNALYGTPTDTLKISKISLTNY
ncbi:hypothetical protein I4U23_015827 [Adineta vaga]|nr:hypothetical protein I4U23_015827 [Adineta vaga]